jgi:hypothetical protein
VNRADPWAFSIRNPTTSTRIEFLACDAVVGVSTRLAGFLDDEIIEGEASGAPKNQFVSALGGL